MRSALDLHRVHLLPRQRARGLLDQVAGEQLGLGPVDGLDLLAGERGA